MRSLNSPSYAQAPNDGSPYTTSDKPGFIGAAENANPYRLKTAPDTLLWQNQVTDYNQDPRYGIVATVGMAGAQSGIPKSGTFVDVSAGTRFGVGSFARTEIRTAYPLRPIIAGAGAARINPALSWYTPGYTSALPSQSDQLSAMLNKPSTGGYSG